MRLGLDQRSHQETVPQYLRKTSHFWLNLLLASCFAEAGFTLPDKHSASAFLSTG